MLVVNKKPAPALKPGLAGLLFKDLTVWFTMALLYLDDWRIQRHLQRTERRLRQQGWDELPPQLQAARARQLDHLNHYWRRRRFPRNQDRAALYAPCFIDAQGRTCAVAHLLIADGQAQLAGRVARAANYAYLATMQFSELDAWAEQSGLTKAELALIQPTYFCPEECLASAQAVATQPMYVIARWMMAGTGLGIVISLANGLFLYRRRQALLRVGALMGVIASAAFLYLGFDFLLANFFFNLFGAIPCPGAGIGDICHPPPSLKPRTAIIDQASEIILSALFFLWFSWVSLFASSQLPPWRWRRLLFMMGGATLLTIVILVVAPYFVQSDWSVSPYQIHPWNFSLFMGLIALITGVIVYFFPASTQPQPLEGADSPAEPTPASYR